MDDEADETDKEIAPNGGEEGWTYPTTHLELGDQDDGGVIQTTTRMQEEQQTQDQHQILSISPSQVDPPSGSTSRKRKAKQSRQSQQPADSNNEAARQTARIGIRDEAALP
ncbi:hypothetical protein BGZ58_006406, partial [Dissophora ornata]